MALTLKNVYQLYINGEWVNASSGKTIEVDNPSTGEVLTKIQEANKDDIDRAVTAAQAALTEWCQTTPVERQDYLLKIAEVIEKNNDYLAEIVSAEMGMPASTSSFLEIPGAADHFKYFAGCIRAEEGFVATIDANDIAITIREPLGVCGLIIPWNFPISISAWKLAPALAAGNTVVIKPSSHSPLSLLELVRLIDEAGILPRGVINVVTGSGKVCGAALTSHPGIDKLSLTGSVEAGKNVLREASCNIIPATMELGGKSPNIFFADCDLDKAVEGAILGLGVHNQGEVCSAGTRAFVQAEIYDEFVERVCKVLAKLKVGPAWNDETEMGPIVSKEQMEKVLSYIEIGKAEGARLKLGGKRITTPPLDKGYFVEPTVFVDVKNSMRIAQEEIFGPVLCIIKFVSEEEVIQMANDNDYGLGAGVWTRDINRALRVSRAIRTGKVWINTYDQVPANVPFGGCKKSGFGREVHKMAIDEYSNFKTIYIHTGEKPYGFYPES
ncbi:MAG: aldehyde dehydrogenase family protein [Clostridia bacterium]|nr:aldehyde dehydrogenase family protein [Clostridia bacterium]